MLFKRLAGWQEWFPLALQARNAWFLFIVILIQYAFQHEGGMDGVCVA